MRARLAVTVVAALLAAPASPQTAPMQSRAPLGAAIRDVLIDTPELLAPLTGTPPAPVDLYADEIARDRALLDRLAPRLFDPARPGLGPEGAPTRIAFFSRTDCPDCARAEAELRDLAERLGVRAAVFDIEAEAGLARALGLDMAPSYVLPDRLVRGAMPAPVLERYLLE
jgi:hypothetical protein